LLDAATGAVRDHWITFECGERGARKRVEVPVPDVRARVAAIELLLREGLGRPPQADEVSVTKLPRDACAVPQMSWDDLQILGATLFAGEISAVLKGNRDGLLRLATGCIELGRARRVSRGLQRARARLNDLSTRRPLTR